MDVFVYSSSKKSGCYVYLPEKDAFDAIPASIRPALGELNFALQFNLAERRKLATEDPQQVLKNLEQQGFHLQINDPALSEEKLKALSAR